MLSSHPQPSRAVILLRQQLHPLRFLAGRHSPTVEGRSSTPVLIPRVAAVEKAEVGEEAEMGAEEEVEVEAEAEVACCFTTVAQR